MRTWIADMNQAIQIYRIITESLDEAGFPNASQNEIIRTCRAKVRHSASQESTEFNTPEIPDTAAFTIRTNPENPDEIKPGMFVRHKSDDYRIVAVKPDEEEKGRTVIVATLREKEEPWRPQA